MLAGMGGHGRPQPALSGSPHRLAWPGVPLSYASEFSGAAKTRIRVCSDVREREESGSEARGAEPEPEWVPRAGTGPARLDLATAVPRRRLQSQKKGAGWGYALPLAESPANYPEPSGRICC